MLEHTLKTPKLHFKRQQLSIIYLFQKLDLRKSYMCVVFMERLVFYFILKKLFGITRRHHYIHIIWGSAYWAEHFKLFACVVFHKPTARDEISIIVWY